MARARALSTSTIANHLGQLVLNGVIADIDGLVPAETVTLVSRAANGQPLGPLAPWKEQFGDQVSYEELHLIRAWLSRPNT